MVTCTRELFHLSTLDPNHYYKVLKLCKMSKGYYYFSGLVIYS